MSRTSSESEPTEPLPPLDDEDFASLRPRYKCCCGLYRATTGAYAWGMATSTLVSAGVFWLPGILIETGLWRRWPWSGESLREGGSGTSLWMPLTGLFVLLCLFDALEKALVGGKWTQLIGFLALQPSKAVMGKKPADKGCEAVMIPQEEEFEKLDDRYKWFCGNFHSLNGAQTVGGITIGLLSGTLLINGIINVKDHEMTYIGWIQLALGLSLFLGLTPALHLAAKRRSKWGILFFCLLEATISILCIVAGAAWSILEPIMLFLYGPRATASYPSHSDQIVVMLLYCLPGFVVFAWFAWVTFAAYRYLRDWQRQMTMIALEGVCS